MSAGVYWRGMKREGVMSYGGETDISIGRDEPVRIGISGSYGGLNLGDEAILSGIISGLRGSLRSLEITVFSRNPDDTFKRHGIERTVAVRSLSRSEVAPEVKRLDLLILGGGGILYDADAPTYLREVAIAQEAGIPVVIYAVSAGPLNDSSVQGMVRERLNRAAAVTVRERNAKCLLEDIGVDRDILVTADPALLLQPRPIDSSLLKEEGLDGKSTLIGFSVREPGPATPGLRQEVYHEYLANAADYMVERFDAHIVFISMEPGVQDIQQSHAVVSKMMHAERTRVIHSMYEPDELLSLVGRFSFGVGMRLHFLIFLAVMGVPFAALPYAAKVEGFLESLDIEKLPLRLNPGRLIAYIDKFWDNRRRMCEQLARAVPLLKKRAMLTNDVVLNVLAGTLRETVER
jgi:polysaccharide pyruvyl transferase CsaB